MDHRTEEIMVNWRKSTDSLAFSAAVTKIIHAFEPVSPVFRSTPAIVQDSLSVSKAC